MKAKLILWFTTADNLIEFLSGFVYTEPGLHADVFSAPSYKMVVIPDVSAYTVESGGQLRFNAGTRGFTINAAMILRQEIKFYEEES